MLITVGNAHLKIHSQCFTRIYPSYSWNFVTQIFKQFFGQELKRSLHKYFGEKQRKIHFQYHIVGPERRYWNWISIHFLPSINHIWPPGANISEKLKYYHDRVWLEKKYLCSKMWKLASSNFERWKGNFELEKGNFQRWKGHFILVSALSKSTASWNRCLLYSSLVETILKQMQHTILNEEDDHDDHDHDGDDIMMLNGRFNQALNYFASNKSHFERNLIRLSLPVAAFPLSDSHNVLSFWQCSQADKRKATLPFAKRY